MNKIIILLIIALAASTGAYLYLNSNNTVETTKVKPSPTPTDTMIKEVDSAEIFDSPNHSGKYRINTLLVRDINSINLFSNLENRLTSTEAMAKNNCTDLVSSGLYTKEFQHIGLFISDSKTLSNKRNNIPSSAYFYIDHNNNPQISASPPISAKLALQSYPYLYNNKTQVNVITSNEEYARRVVVAITTNNEVVFMIFYVQGSVYSGPRLDELPGLIQKYQERESVQFTDVLNLDGGKHSTMISRFISLPEISTIGGYFCMVY